MYILDAIIIIVFLFGILSGVKRGLIKTSVSLIGMIICLLLAFYLKNPVSAFFYKNLPFFEIKGIFEGVSVINILIYEFIAFLIIFILLYILLKIIVKITGILEKILNATVILGFFSSVGGAIIGFIESYIIVFIFLFIFTQPFITIKGIENSWLSDKILDSSPVLTKSVKDTKDLITEMYVLHEQYKNDKKTYNKKSVELFLNYEIIDQESVNILKKKGKLDY